VFSRKSGKTLSAIPLLQLVKQLLRNSGAQSLAQLNDISSITRKDRNAQRISPHLSLLLKFQRLLFEKLWCRSSQDFLSSNSDCDPENDLVKC
jgi:hypothetical protein